MNDTAENTTRSPAGAYRPTLNYYHPNARGTGCAVRFELHPAHDNVGGSIFATLARQRSVGGMNGGQRVFPSFDWTNRICVKLDMSDLSQMLQVFRGMLESVGDGKGLFHSSESASTIIRLEHRIEPVPGYLFDVRKKTNSDDVSSCGLVFSPTEALGLSLAIEQSMGYIAFGIPKVMPRERPLAAPTPSAEPLAATGTEGPLPF